MFRKINLKAIRKRILAATIIAASVVGILQPITVTAAESAVTTTDTGFSENFIPTRSFYPSYLSKNASQKSTTIKKIWERLFYEEWKNPNWSKAQSKGGYYVNETTDYHSLGEGPKSFEGKNFAKDSKDFDAFLGQSLISNKEFLGELVGLPGYAPIESKLHPNETTNIQNLMKNIVYTKLTNPETYQYFAKAMAELTADGAYIGVNTVDKAGHVVKGCNNLLKDVSYNGQPFDIWMLSCLAFLYEGDGSETYLNDAQVAWLKSYQRYLYDDYVDNGANSLAKKYPSIYELIARSTDASNNYRGYGQEFFNYVVDSKQGGGAWLNQNTNINVANLEQVDNLAEMFKFAIGWCGGFENENTCRDHASCIHKMTDYDKFAMALKNNTTALYYINANETVSATFGKSINDQNGYQYRYMVKHTRPLDNTNPNSLNIPMNNLMISKGNTRQTAKSWHSSFHGEGTGVAVAYAHLLTTLNLKDILPSDSNPDGVSNPQFIIIGIYAEGEYACKMTKDPPTNGNTNSHSVSRKKDFKITCSEGIDPIGEVKFKDYEALGGVPTKNKKNVTKFYKFDVSGLTDVSMLEAAKIQISVGASSSADATNAAGSSSPEGATYYTYARVDAMPTVFVESPINDCDINEHSYNGSIKWGENYSTATITYTCRKDNTLDKSHNMILTSPVITHDTINGITTHKAIGAYGETYRMVVNKDNRKPMEPAKVILNDSNASNYKDNDYGAIVINPMGSGPNDIHYGYTHASVKLHNGSLRKGHIPLGVKKIEIYYTASEVLEELIFYVKSGNGKTIGYAYVTSNTGKVTINLSDTSDKALTDSYIDFDGSAYTKHELNDYWWNGQPAPSSAKLSVDKILMYF